LESHAAGRFPIENLVTSYPFAEINQAIADIRSGTALKAVLVMP
jgi:aryl-alcohol dehydrogenase